MTAVTAPRLLLFLGGLLPCRGVGRLSCISVPAPMFFGIRVKKRTAPPAVLQGLSMKETLLNALLEQARQGDREALGRLLETQRAALRRLAERQLHGPITVRVDASDIIQQTFLEAHRSFPQFAGGDSRELAGWL